MATIESPNKLHTLKPVPSLSAPQTTQEKMEDLQKALLPAAVGVVGMTFSTVGAMMAMIKTRYAMKDDNDKPLFPHPYKPWDKVDEKHSADAQTAYRCFR